jgi:hypothetical protein
MRHLLSSLTRAPRARHVGSILAASLCAFALLSVPGCYGEDPDVGVAEQAVINGTPVSAAENPNQVALYRKPGGVTWGPRPCTATVLGGDWVLTARHCTETSYGAADIPPSWMALSTQVAPGLAPPAGSVVPTQVVRHPSLDVALIRAAVQPNRGPLIGSNNPNSEVQFYEGVPPVGTPLTCYGYGRSVCLPYDAPEDGTSGAGTLRKGTFTVSETYPNAYRVVGAAGQSLWNGDSGGACFFEQDGRSYLTGVHVIAAADCSSAVDTTGFKAWLQSTTGCSTACPRNWFCCEPEDYACGLCAPSGAYCP